MRPTPEYFDAEHPPRIYVLPIADSNLDAELPAVELHCAAQDTVQDLRRYYLAIFLGTIVAGAALTVVSDYVACQQSKVECSRQFGR